MCFLSKAFIRPRARTLSGSLCARSLPLASPKDPSRSLEASPPAPALGPEQALSAPLWAGRDADGGINGLCWGVGAWKMEDRPQIRSEAPLGLCSQHHGDHCQMVSFSPDDVTLWLSVHL